jgi:acyl-homoserine-lactone acylase
MKVIKRIGGGLLIVILLTGLALAVWEPLSISSASPPPEKKYEVRIVRDDFCVPHIFGKTDADVAFGVAYAHAEDDFDTLQEVTAMTRGGWQRSMVRMRRPLIM